MSRMEEFPIKFSFSKLNLFKEYGFTLLNEDNTEFKLNSDEYLVSENRFQSEVKNEFKNMYSYFDQAESFVTLIDPDEKNETLVQQNLFNDFYVHYKNDSVITNEIDFEFPSYLESIDDFYCKIQKSPGFIETKFEHFLDPELSSECKNQMINELYLQLKECEDFISEDPNFKDFVHLYMYPRSGVISMVWDKIGFTLYNTRDLENFSDDESEDSFPSEEECNLISEYKNQNENYLLKTAIDPNNITIFFPNSLNGKFFVSNKEFYLDLIKHTYQIKFLIKETISLKVNKIKKTIFVFRYWDSHINTAIFQQLLQHGFDINKDSFIFLKSKIEGLKVLLILGERNYSWIKVAVDRISNKIIESTEFI